MALNDFAFKKKLASPPSACSVNKEVLYSSILASLLLLGLPGAAAAANETQKAAKTQNAPPPVAPPDHPWDKKFYLNGITITPGGFFAGEGVWRSRNIQSDIGSNYPAIPNGTSPLYYMNESRFSARQSRLSALVEGPYNRSMLFSGYVEADFLGNGSANENESNSFDLRIRNFYANIDWISSGWHFLAGQSWSLATTNNKGITPRNEVVPPTIDAQYVPGFIWKRQPQFRLTKNFGEQVWLAISAENPQFTEGGSICGTVGGANGGNATGTAFGHVRGQYCFAPGTGTLPSIVNFSLNKTPDVIGKLAFESSFAGHKVHVEGIGMYRQFYDRVYTTFGNRNFTSTGWGFGGGAFLEVIPKLLDLQGNALVGHGIGTYGAGQLPDTTLTSDGSLIGIPEVILMAGLTLHATSKLDLYLFGGKETEKRSYFNVGNTYFGYGIPTANNTGCTIEGGTCAGNNKEIWQITAGLWDKLYKGSYGELKGGLQYSHTVRVLFSGNGGTTPTRYIDYSTDDDMVFFSLRYYPYVPGDVSPAQTK